MSSDAWRESSDGGPEEAGTRGARGASVDRRAFLKLGGVGAAAALAACQRVPVKHAIPYLVPAEEITPGVSAHYATTCTACPAACGLIATVRDGRPIKLEGNPDHPLSRGGLCALGQGDLRGLYDPGRLRGPRVHGADAGWEALDSFVTAGLGAALDQGREIWIVTPTLPGPSARAAVGAFASRWRARAVEWDAGPETPRGTLDAYATLDGNRCLPWLDIEAADLLVAFDADLLGTAHDPVAHTAAYAARRRAAADAERPFRHVQIEGSLSLTGAAADERLTATASERRRLAAWLLRRVAERSNGVLAAQVSEALASLPAPERYAARIEALAAALASAPGRGLAVAGGDDAALALAVALVNRLGKNEGRTLDLARPSRVSSGGDREVSELLAALDAGRVGGLVLIGVDPVDQLAEGGTLAEALRSVATSVAITDRPTATAAACAAVAAAHHGLESWGDFEPRPGVVSLAQPSLRPLFDTRSPFENLLRWAGAPVSDYRLFVRARWEREVFPAARGADFERFWNEAVRTAAAVPAASAAARGAKTNAGLAAALRSIVDAGTPDAAPEALEADLIAEVGVRDGLRAHVPWLRELPDPLTRVSWTPCVRMAPERADALGVADGDRVEIACETGTVVLPVRVLPGQHPQVLGVPVGYGRADGDPGRPERNAYRLSALGAGTRRGIAIRIRATGETEPLPLVQGHDTTEGRPLVFQVASPGERVHGSHRPEGRDLWPEWGKPSPQWEMVIDLDACTACSACVVACQAENNVPVVGPQEIGRNRGMHWLRIDRYFAGAPEQPDVLFEPMLCAQCEHAPCETVCPVAATIHSEDGLNQQVYNRCVGTRYCANNCPYKVRAFNWFDYEATDPLERMVLNPDVVVRSRGVMEKCTFCVQRIQAGRIAARAAGEPGVREVRTACQQSCPARAITFGDATDPDGEIARLKARPRAFQVLAELGIEPSVTYLARVRNRDGTAAHQEA